MIYPIDPESGAITISGARSMRWTAICLGASWLLPAVSLGASFDVGFLSITGMNQRFGNVVVKFEEGKVKYVNITNGSKKTARWITVNLELFEKSKGVEETKYLARHIGAADTRKTDFRIAFKKNAFRLKTAKTYPGRIRKDILEHSELFQSDTHYLLVTIFSPDKGFLSRPFLKGLFAKTEVRKPPAK